MSARLLNVYCCFSYANLANSDNDDDDHLHLSSPIKQEKYGNDSFDTTSSPVRKNGYSNGGSSNLSPMGYSSNGVNGTGSYLVYHKLFRWPVD